MNLTEIFNNLEIKVKENKRVQSGTIENTKECCKMLSTGYWIGKNGRHITSYKRIDKEDNKQYSMDRHRRFWVETID